VRVALRSIKGVETVDVSLERGKAVATFAPGNTVRYEQLLRAIEKNGFVVKGSNLTVDGQVVSNGNAPELQVSGSNERFRLAASGNLYGANQLTGAVEVIGSVPEVPKGKTPDVLRYESVVRK
jgi:copper chaperone CopZ